MHNLGHNTDQIRRWQSPMAVSVSKRMAIREALVADRAARQASPDFPRIHENSHVRDDTKESSLESIEHSVGCPKYKCSSKSKCQLRSPNRAPKVLHPKPWGARDPKEIPCTCFTKRKSQKSAPASIRTSPTRELRKSVPRRTHSPRSHLFKEDTVDDVEEVMRKFDEFCDHAERTGVKLSPSTLDEMFNKMRNKLCNTSLNSTAKTKIQSGRMGKRRTSSLDSTKQVQDAVGLKTLPEVPQDQRSQSNQSHQPSVTPSTVRGKLEANNVVLELSGTDFPDQTATFTNIFGSMLPTERFNYVALGGNQFFGPGEVLSPGIPTATIVIDSTEGYLPVNDVVVPARLPRSPHRSLRRKHL